MTHLVIPIAKLLSVYSRTQLLEVQNEAYCPEIPIVPWGSKQLFLFSLPFLSFCKHLFLWAILHSHSSQDTRSLPSSCPQVLLEVRTMMLFSLYSWLGLFISSVEKNSLFSPTYHPLIFLIVGNIYFHILSIDSLHTGTISGLRNLMPKLKEQRFYSLGQFHTSSKHQVLPLITEGSLGIWETAL